MSPTQILANPAAHAATLARIHAAAMKSGAWSEAAFRDQGSQPGVFGCVLADGFLLARIVAGECEILTFAVHPDYQRRGLGKILLNAALAHAAGQGCTTMFLDVAEDNAAARGLYKKAGFQEMGRRKRYYAHGADALLLQYSLMA